MMEILFRGTTFASLRLPDPSCGLIDTAGQQARRLSWRLQRQEFLRLASPEILWDVGRDLEKGR